MQPNSQDSQATYTLAHGTFGVDVSSRSLRAAHLTSVTGKPSFEKEVPLTKEGIDSLLKCVPAEAPWVVEPTGRYSTIVVQQAREAGRVVLLARARPTSIYLRSQKPRAKTDKFDSRGLARFALSSPLPLYPLKNPAVDKVDQLLSVRKLLAHSLSQARQQALSLPLAKEELDPTVEHLQERIQALDKAIAAHIKAAPGLACAAKLQKIPGIGPVTAAAVASRLSQKQFAHPDQFVAYIGLDIGVRQSGKREGRTGLSKYGDAELRRLLYVCAQAARCAKESPFKAQYERERAKGLPTTAALCAVARKLAKVCWSIHKYGSDYDPERVHNAPKREKDEGDSPQQQHQETQPIQTGTEFIEKEERAAGGAGAASAPRC